MAVNLTRVRGALFSRAFREFWLHEWRVVEARAHFLPEGFEVRRFVSGVPSVAHELHCLFVMMSRGAAIEITKGLAEKGELEVGKNVYVVQLMGVMLITGRMPREVRNELMAAVKAGQIGRIKKEGLAPEAFHHKNARANALDARAQVVREGVKALLKVYAPANALDD